AITGYLLFAWNAMQFLFSPILGAWSDRFGRRPIILLSCFGLGIDYIVMALAPTLSWLFVGRIISGITASNISTAFAYVTDVTPPEKRAKPFGYVSAAFGLGFVIGPAVGGYLGNFHIRAPFWVAAGLSLVNSLYGFFVLRSLRVSDFWSLGGPVREAFWRAPQRSLWTALRHSGLCGIRAGNPWMGVVRRHSFHRFVGHRRSRGAIADVAQSGSFFARETARSDQFSARGHRNGWTGFVHASLCAGDRPCHEDPSSRCAVLSRRHTVALELAAGGLCDTARRGNRTARRTTGSFFRSIGLSRH